jgi:hypothetical protein
MDHKKSTGKMENALAEFEFRHLGKLLFFNTTERLWREITRDQKMFAVLGSPCTPTPLI